MAFTSSLFPLSDSCPECCNCPSSTILTASVSSSKSKCGVDSTPFAPSTPPHEYYLKITDCTASYIGKKYVSTYTRNPCAHTEETFCDAYCAGIGFTNPDDGRRYLKKTSTTTAVTTYGTPMYCYCDGAGPSTVMGTTVTIDTQEYVSSSPDCFALNYTYGGTTSYSCTTQPTVDISSRCAYECTGTRNSDGTWHLHVVQTGEGCDGGGSDETYDSAYPCDASCGDVESTTVDVYENIIEEPSYPLYEIPYTLSDLIDDTIAALGSYSSPTESSPIASRTTSTDEVSFAAEKSHYKFSFPAPKVGNGSCYKITWVERFTPAGGDPVDTPMSFTWDGTITAGYGSTDFYELTVPDTDGEKIIGYYTDPSDTSTFTRDYLLEECRGCG